MSNITILVGLLILIMTQKGESENMYLLPPKYLQSVVALGRDADLKTLLETGEPMRKAATGFLYAYPASENQDTGFRLWLVTCKHVVQPGEESPLTEVMVRMNKSGDQGMVTFRIRKDSGPKWTFHPKADVAVIPTSWPDLEDKGITWETFAAGRNALRRNEAVELGLTEGDEVFVLGFPVGWRKGRKDYPIVRYGMLAQVQGWLNNDHDTFLVDGSGFPGNSGGPVVTKPPSKTEQPESWLIGMVSERRFSPAPVYIGNPAKETDMIQVEETANLIEVIPMDFIDETIVLAMQR